MPSSKIRPDNSVQPGETSQLHHQGPKFSRGVTHSGSRHYELSGVNHSDLRNRPVFSKALHKEAKGKQPGSGLIFQWMVPSVASSLLHFSRIQISADSKKGTMRSGPRMLSSLTVICKVTSVGGCMWCSSLEMRVLCVDSNQDSLG